MSTSAAEAFHVVSLSLDTCKNARSSGEAVRVAESLNFREHVRASPYVIVSLIFRDEAGNSVTLNEKWHDPSGPFQNEPDIHRLRLTLNIFGASPVELMVEYEG